MSPPTPILILTFFSLFGLYTTWYLLYNNDTISIISSSLCPGSHLPGINVPTRRVYTGIEPLDHHLAARVVFFWSIVDGSKIEASLFVYHFAGQALVGWALLVIESLRFGKGRGMGRSGTVFWGLAALAFGYSTILPWYCILHLLTSPMTKPSSTSAPKLTDYLLDLSDIISVVPAILIGFVLPTVMMALPAPSILTYSQKQLMIANWHLFPLYVGFAQLLVSLLLQKSFPSQKPSANKTKTTQQDFTPNIWAMRALYAFLLLLGARDQLTTNHLLFLSQLFPSLFASTYRGIWTFTNVFGQKAITPALKMKEVGEGAHLFLLFDENIGNVAVIVWAMVLFARARRCSRKAREGLHWAMVFAVGFVLTMFTGAMGLATAAIWGRDEIIFAGIGEGTGKEVEGEDGEIGKEDE